MVVTKASASSQHASEARNVSHLHHLNTPPHMAIQHVPSYLHPLPHTTTRTAPP